MTRDEIAALPTICDGPDSVFALLRARRDAAPKPPKRNPGLLFCRKCDRIWQRGTVRAGELGERWKCPGCGNIRPKRGNR